MARKKIIRYALSRTKRNALIVAFFFFLMPVLVVLDHQYGGHVRRYIERFTYTNADFQKYHRKTFTVLEVIDGDTIDINIPDGKFENTRVRLIGVDTPETKHPAAGLMYYGPEATAFTTQMVLGEEVTIVLDTVGDVRDRYSRLLAFVVLPDDRVLNEELILNGYAYAYLSFPHSEFDKYRLLMDEAIVTKIGLWQKVTRDQLPKWLRSKRPDLLRHP